MLKNVTFISLHLSVCSSARKRFKMISLPFISETIHAGNECKGLMKLALVYIVISRSGILTREANSNTILTLHCKYPNLIFEKQNILCREETT